MSGCVSLTKPLPAHFGVCIFIRNLPSVKRGEQQKGGGGDKAWDLLETPILRGSAGWNTFKSKESPKFWAGLEKDGDR